MCCQPHPSTKKWWRSKKTPPARGWTAADICTNCVYTIPAPRDGARFRFFAFAGRRSMPPGWLCSSQKQGDVESNPSPTTCIVVLVLTLCTYISSELGKGATTEVWSYLFGAVNVWWRCVQYFVIASCG